MNFLNLAPPCFRPSSPMLMMQDRSDQGGGGAATRGGDKLSSAQLELVRQIDADKEQLIQILKSTNCVPILLELTEAMLPVLESSARFVAFTVILETS